MTGSTKRDARAEKDAGSEEYAATEQDGVRDYLLALADDEHLMGQQHTEWIGVAPFLEEDLAFSSIGQDELGHAVLLYELVCELDGVEVTDAAVDGLAYRAGDDYRSCALVEYQTADWAEALVRHWSWRPSASESAVKRSSIAFTPIH
jgi:ring-1,2-phenylacetyl-CoA epoxidase subunit PaaC